MTTQKKQEVYPTMKITVKKDDENAVLFEDCQIEILEITSDVETVHGKKIIATVLKDDDKYSVFMNQVSVNNLIEAFGEDDDGWKGKLCDLKEEVAPKYKNKMIVFYPVK